MEDPTASINGNYVSPRRRNGRSPSCRSSSGPKANGALQEERNGHSQSPSLRRSFSQKTLKKKEGGKSILSQSKSGTGRTTNQVTFENKKGIKVPKAKSSRRHQLSRVKKYELEKQTLLIMDQMLSHVKDFTNKERYFDYKKISGNIKAFKIPHQECKRIWESFKSRLRGQFKEGNEEMRQCRNECNKDFWSHQYKSYPFRLSIYNKMLSHPDIMEEFRKLSEIFEQNQFSIHNELLELQESEEKLMPILEDFEYALKNADSHEELDQLDASIEQLGAGIQEGTPEVEDAPKRKYKSKDETEVFNEVMSRIYTDMREEYDKKVYNPLCEQEAKEEVTDEKADEAAKILGLAKNRTESTDPNDATGPQDSPDSKQWSDIEIIHLLRGIYQYGEPKWAEIHASFEFNGKTPHDLSRKWMDIRYQMMKDIKMFEDTQQVSCRQLTWLVACIKKLQSKLGKPERELLTPMKDISGVMVKIPFKHTPPSKIDIETKEDTEMLHYMSLASRNIKIFKITRNASRDDMDSSSRNGGTRRYKRRRINEDGESEYLSDSTDFDVIPPKTMYGTINTLYKDYIRLIDCDSNPEFVDLGRKYYSKAFFNIDKTEHKKVVKEKRREQKRIK
jgi:hypothetical protein